MRSLRFTQAGLELKELLVVLLALKLAIIALGYVGRAMVRLASLLIIFNN